MCHFHTSGLRHRDHLWGVFFLFMTLSGTNIISATTVAAVARIFTKQYNPLVATKRPLLWDLFNTPTNLLDLRYISVALGKILELFELLLLCFSNHTRCHRNFCKFHCNVFRQESSALSVFLKPEKQLLNFQQLLSDWRVSLEWFCLYRLLGASLQMSYTFAWPWQCVLLSDGL